MNIVILYIFQICKISKIVYHLSIFLILICNFVETFAIMRLLLLGKAICNYANIRRSDD